MFWIRTTDFAEIRDCSLNKQWKKRKLKSFSAIFLINSSLRYRGEVLNYRSLWLTLVGTTFVGIYRPGVPDPSLRSLIPELLFIQFFRNYLTSFYTVNAYGVYPLLSQLRIALGWPSQLLGQSHRQSVIPFASHLLGGAKKDWCILLGEKAFEYCQLSCWKVF